LDYLGKKATGPRKNDLSYVGEMLNSKRQLLSGELEVEFANRATWPTSCAPGGAGIARLNLLPAGVGTRSSGGKKKPAEFSMEKNLFVRAVYGLQC